MAPFDHKRTRNQNFKNLGVYMRYLITAGFIGAAFIAYYGGF
jgi:hypothetical protein